MVKRCGFSDGRRAAAYGRRKRLHDGQSGKKRKLLPRDRDEFDGQVVVRDGPECQILERQFAKGTGRDGYPFSGCCESCGGDEIACLANDVGGVAAGTELANDIRKPILLLELRDDKGATRQVERADRRQRGKWIGVIDRENHGLPIRSEDR